MKNLTLYSVLLFVIFSCKKDTGLDSYAYPQKWVLKKMTTEGFSTKVLTGAQMSWQEFYVLKQDGTFTKSREIGGVSSEASGTLSFREELGENFLVLTYKTGFNLIGSCTSYEQKEELMIQSGKLKGTWAACDGPGLEYEKVAL